MTRDELVDFIAKQLDLSRKDAKLVVASVQQTPEIKLNNFGKNDMISNLENIWGPEPSNMRLQ